MGALWGSSDPKNASQNGAKSACRGYTNGRQHMKSRARPFTGKMQIRTTMRDHFTPAMMAIIIFFKRETSVDEGVGKSKASHTASRDDMWPSPVGDSLEVPQKINYRIPI